MSFKHAVAVTQVLSWRLKSHQKGLSMPYTQRVSHRILLVFALCFSRPFVSTDLILFLAGLSGEKHQTNSNQKVENIVHLFWQLSHIWSWTEPLNPCEMLSSRAARGCTLGIGLSRCTSGVNPLETSVKYWILNKGSSSEFCDTLKILSLTEQS